MKAKYLHRWVFVYISLRKRPPVSSPNLGLGLHPVFPTGVFLLLHPGFIIFPSQDPTLYEQTITTWKCILGEWEGRKMSCLTGMSLISNIDDNVRLWYIKENSREIQFKPEYMSYWKINNNCHSWSYRDISNYCHWSTGKSLCKKTLTFTREVSECLKFSIHWNSMFPD